MADMNAHLPMFVRRRDGSQVPFDADQICQTLFEAAAKLGNPSAFLARELTDVVQHFLSLEDWPSITSTAQIADFVEKIVSEAGQPALARTFGEMQRDITLKAPRGEQQATEARPHNADQLIARCFEAFEREAIFSPDVSAALADGLIRTLSPVAPTALASLVLDTRQFAELPWWGEFANWRDAGGAAWIVDGPEWLCTGQMNPSFTSHLSERLLALPTLASRSVELHLNCSQPPAWAQPFPARPLFNLGEDDANAADRGSFLDGLLERWKALDVADPPTIAWHLDSAAFADHQRSQRLITLLRQALHGRVVRFFFDRPNSAITLGSGLDRKTPGVILEVGLDLAALMRKTNAHLDAVGFLQKLPSLVRLAVSAIRQKQAFVKLHAKNPLVASAFTIERSVGVIVPLGLAEVVRALTGERLTRSPLSLDFAERILSRIKATLEDASRSANVELRVDNPTNAEPWSSDSALPIDEQLVLAGRLHAAADGGAAILPIDADSDPEALSRHLRRALETSTVRSVTLCRTASGVKQAELAL